MSHQTFVTKIISNSTWTLRARAASATPPSPFCCSLTKHKHNEADDDDEASQLGNGAAVQDVDNKKCSCCDLNAGDEAEAGEQLTKCHSTSTATPALAASSLQGGTLLHGASNWTLPCPVVCRCRCLLPQPFELRRRRRRLDSDSLIFFSILLLSSFFLPLLTLLLLLLLVLALSLPSFSPFCSCMQLSLLRRRFSMDLRAERHGRRLCIKKGAE